MIQGSAHTEAFYRFSGQKYSYRAKGMSRVLDLDTPSQRAYAVECAINEGGSKIFAVKYNYNVDKYDYEVEVISVRIVYFAVENGKQSGVKRHVTLPKKQIQTEINKEHDLNKKDYHDEPLTEQEKNRQFYGVYKQELKKEKPPKDRFR